MKKIAIVTGCSKGIGREIALELARDGYSIIGTYNTSNKLIDELSNKVNNIGVEFHKYKLNLLDNNSIGDFINYVKNNFKNIDILVNNAGLCLDNEFDLKTRDEFIDVLKVNLVGPFSLIQGLHKSMNNGIIINISSNDGIDTYTKFDIDYSASKAGLINLTKSLSLILNNIKIYGICPNWVDTESINKMNTDYLKEEMNRIGQRKLIKPEEIANKVISLIDSDLKSGSIVVMRDSNE